MRRTLPYHHDQRGDHINERTLTYYERVTVLDASYDVERALDDDSIDDDSIHAAVVALVRAIPADILRDAGYHTVTDCGNWAAGHDHAGWKSDG